MPGHRMERAVPDLEDIDAAWILQDIARRNAEAPSTAAGIRIYLSTTVPTSSGPVTVSRDLELTPQEVLAILRSRGGPTRA